MLLHEHYSDCILIAPAHVSKWPARIFKFPYLGEKYRYEVKFSVYICGCGSHVSKWPARILSVPYIGE